MTKKILLDIFKKTKWSILLSVIILIYLYGEVNKMVFAYFCYLEIVNLLNEYSQSKTEDFIITSDKIITSIKNNIDKVKIQISEIIKILDKDN